VSWLANLVLPELGTAQPQLVAKLSPSSSSSWAELALFLISCTATTRASSEIAENDQNLLTNICRSTLVKLKTIEKIEDDLHGRLLK
jgi:hypothetical protein